MAHLGKHLHRLGDNPLEKEFSARWKRLNDNGSDILGYLLGEGNRSAGTTDEQEMVAATAIQWLGSPVGQSLLRDVLATDAGKAFLASIPHSAK